MAEVGLWHQGTIRDLTNLKESDPNILAMVLFGSAANSPAELDQWSDLDLFLVVDDRSVDQYFLDLKWLGQFGEIFAHDQSENTFTKTSRIVFTDLKRMDIVIASSSSFRKVDHWPQNPFCSGYAILYSKANWINEKLAELIVKDQPALASAPDVQRLIDGFWFKGTLAVDKVARNDLLIALHLALDLVRDCCVLGMLIRDRAEGVTHHKTGGVGNEYVKKLRSAEQPFTAEGILDMIEKCSQIFDELTYDWSDEFAEKRYTLLKMVDLAREYHGKGS